MLKPMEDVHIQTIQSNKHSSTDLNKNI